MMPGNPVVGSTVLRRPAIQSPNYVAGTAGWTVNSDGSAEFNNLTVRGTFAGTDYVLNSSGLFIYSGTPALGNLLVSVAPAAGTDAHGNIYEQGFVTYPIIAGTTYGLRTGTSTVNGSPSPSVFLDNISGSPPNTSPAYSFGAASNTGAATVMYSGMATVGSAAAYVEAADSTLSGQAGGEVVIGAGLVSLPTAGAWIQADTWNDMRPLSNSFVGTIASRYPPQYRMLPDGDVEITGNVQFPPSGGPNFNSVTFATLPSAYRPGSNTGHKWPVTFESNVTLVGTPNVQVDTSGNLQFHNVPTSGMTSVIANISGRYPLNKTGLITS